MLGRRDYTIEFESRWLTQIAARQSLLDIP